MQLSLFDYVAAEAQKAPQRSPAMVSDEEYNLPPVAGLPTVDSILRKIQNASARHGTHEILSAVIECGAIAISNKFDKPQAPEREKRYLQIIKGFDPDTQKLIASLFGEIAVLLMHMINPHVGFRDYLGELFMKSETSSSKAGQFFTPYSVSKMCAQITINETDVKAAIEQDRILTLSEPACGSGGMVLAAADVLYNQYRFNVSRNLVVECSDIDSRCVHMAYLQLSLAGIPAVIYQRDTLTLQTWQRWETPAYIMQWLRFREVLK